MIPFALTEWVGRGVEKALLQLQHRVILLDLPGGGHTPVPSIKLTWCGLHVFAQGSKNARAGEAPSPRGC
jgi:hypothetical protein